MAFTFIIPSSPRRAKLRGKATTNASLMKHGPSMTRPVGRSLCVAVAACAGHPAAHATFGYPAEFMLLIGLVFAAITALPFAVAAFILRRFRVGLLQSIAMVSGALLALIIVLTDVGPPDWGKTIAFRFVGTLIVLAPLFALAWWLGGLGRRGAKVRQSGNTPPR